MKTCSTANTPEEEFLEEVKEFREKLDLLSEENKLKYRSKIKRGDFFMGLSLVLSVILAIVFLISNNLFSSI